MVLGSREPRIEASAALEDASLRSSPPTLAENLDLGEVRDLLNAGNLLHDNLLYFTHGGTIRRDRGNGEARMEVTSGDNGQPVPGIEKWGAARHPKVVQLVEPISETSERVRYIEIHPSGVRAPITASRLSVSDAILNAGRYAYEQVQQKIGGNRSASNTA